MRKAALLLPVAALLLPTVQAEPAPAPGQPAAQPLPRPAEETTTQVKRLLLARDIRTAQAAGRTTPENLRQCAAEARTAGLNELADLAEGEADEHRSRRERHELQQQWEQRIAGLGVDERDIAHFVLTVGPEVAAEVLDRLPLRALFNIPSEAQCSAPALQLQVHKAAGAVPQLVKIYAAIRSPETAEAALPELLPPFCAFISTQPLRLLAPEPLREAVCAQHAERIRALPLPQLNEQRQRLQAADYYGNATLRALDCLLR